MNVILFAITHVTSVSLFKLIKRVNYDVALFFTNDSIW